MSLDVTVFTLIQDEAFPSISMGGSLVLDLSTGSGQVAAQFWLWLRAEAVAKVLPVPGWNGLFGGLGGMRLRGRQGGLRGVGWVGNLQPAPYPLPSHTCSCLPTPCLPTPNLPPSLLPSAWAPVLLALLLLLPGQTGLGLPLLLTILK